MAPQAIHQDSFGLFKGLKLRRWHSLVIGQPVPMLGYRKLQSCGDVGTVMLERQARARLQKSL